MKKLYSCLAMLAFVCTSYAQFPAPYCPVTFPSGVEPISVVQFAGINNLTSAVIAGAVAHENFTAITGNVTAGTSYPITVNGNTGGNFSNIVNVYVDWNQDNDFDDAGESFLVGTLVNNTGTGTPITSNIIVPITAMGGTTRMRVIKRFNAAGLPCNITGYGQAEDYTLAVVAAVNCTGTPTVGAVTASVTTTCAGRPFNLSAVVTPTAGFSYQWQKSVDAGATWTALGAAQINSGYTVASQEVATSYRLIVTCTTSNLSVTSAAVSVAQNIYSDCYCVTVIPYTCNDGDLILNVTFAGIDNDSDCSEPTGYTNYSATITAPDVPKGSSQNISVTVGPSGGGWMFESAGVWIDFNHNGVFDEAEYTYIGTGLDQVLTQAVLIPATAIEGPTRMRVISTATVATAFNAGVVCGPVDANTAFGEAEDYTINIIPALSTESFVKNTFAMYPNPTNSQVTIDLGAATNLRSVSIYALSGQEIIRENVNSSTSTHTMNVNRLATGVYLVKVTTDSGTFSQRLMKQ